MSKRKIFIPLTLIALVFIIGAAVILLQRGHAERNELQEAKSWSEVKAFQYEQTPGLERAEELGLARQIGQVIDIPNAETSVQFDEVWYNSANVYIFYSVKMDSLPKLDDLPIISFKVQGDQQPFWGNLTDMYYQGRLYGRFAVPPLSVGGELLKHVDQLVVSDLSVRWNGADVGGASGPVTLDVHYDESEERSEYMPLSQTYEAMNRKIELVRLEIGSSFDFLIDRSFLSRSKEITVTLGNLSVEWNIDWKSDVAVATVA